jgi:hypothetical protein
MSSTISVSALLLLVSVTLAPAVPRPTMALPQMVLAHPAAETPSSTPAAQPPWFARGLAAWGGPQPPPHEGSYDKHYITW